MNNSIQVNSLQSAFHLPANLSKVLDSNPCPLTPTATSKARNLITTLNKTAGGSLVVKVQGLEVTVQINSSGSVDSSFKRSVTPATLQRAFCAFLSEVFTTLY